jgi:hypothetical protein
VFRTASAVLCWQPTCQPGGCPNAKPFAKEFDDLNYLAVVNSKAVQRLRFREGFSTAFATTALHGAVAIAEVSEASGFAIAAVTIQLAFLGKAS